MKKIRLLDTFAGVGGFHLALEQSVGKENIECIGYSEIDKYARKVYEERFPGTYFFGDISMIDIVGLPDFDLLTGGFPCQDVSVAGKQSLEGGKTILVEYLLRILEEKKPSCFVFENVKGLMSNKFKDLRESIFDRITKAGYGFDYKILNTRDFGLPQNRERVFIVGMYLGENIGLDNVGGKLNWNFPKKQKLTKFLKDILEDEVEDKYYYKSNLYEKLVEEDGITTNSPKHTYKVNVSGHDVLKRAYSKNGISPTLNSCGGGNRQSKVVLNVNPSGRGMNGNVYKINTEAPTLTTNKGEGIKILDDVRIRKLTPTEYARLQGFPDNWSTEFVSNSQAYKQMGNAISVPVVRAIFDNLL